jgi:hypothetical protein
MDIETPSEPQRCNGSFHSSLKAGIRQSAAALVPLLVQSINPKSVVDVGCASDEWLSAFREHGVTDLYELKLNSLPAPVQRERGDLAVCLDSAQPLDIESASKLVAGLTRLAHVIVFSTKVCHGDDGQIKDQWQSYWTRLFDTHGYQAFFALRHSLWENEDVEIGYRQNIICFCHRGHSELIARLVQLETATSAPADVVHPDRHLQIAGGLAKWRRSSEHLERRIRDSAAEVHGLKSEVDRLRTELRRLNNYAPLRAYRSFRRAVTGTKTTRPAGPRAAQEHKRGDAMTLAKLIEQSPHFHAWPDGKPANWAVPPDVLRFICDHVKPGMHSLETGAGQTTVAFALAGAQHITITPDGGQIERIQDYLRQNGIDNKVSFVQASSDAVLPTGEGIPERLDFVFIDGAHRFPFPIIDWYYTAGRVPVGGIVAVDDCRMPSVRILHDFLAGEDDWELVHLIHVTSFFRRVRATVSEWDWADQKINKPHLDMITRKSAPERKDDPIARILRKLI